MKKNIRRMLQPDIVIQDAHNAQAYNSYSYCLNNPLRHTDPSGYEIEDGWYVNKRGKITWDDNVNRAADVPDGGTYIGLDDKDILKYYGLRETYESIQDTRWGISFGGVSMGYDHNGNLYPNQSPWLILTIPSGRISGYINTSVKVCYNTDEVSGTNKKGKVFDGINFVFHLSQSSYSMDFKGVARLKYSGQIQEKSLTVPNNSESRIRTTGSKYSNALITVNTKEIIDENSFIKATISVSTVNNSLLFQPKPVEMIWDLSKPKLVPNPNTLKYYYLLYEK